MYRNVYEEQAVPDRNYVKDNQAPQQSRTDPSNYFIKDSNYEISPSIIEEDDTSVYDIYPETLALIFLSSLQVHQLFSRLLLSLIQHPLVFHQ